MHKYYAVIAVFMILSCPAWAQEAVPSAQKYSLAALVSLALKTSPLLSAQDARVEEKRLSAAQARVWQGPSAGVLFGRTKQTETSGSRYELSLSQSIPLAGIPGLRGRLLGLESESSRVERETAEVLVTLSVAQGAYEYAAGRRKAVFAESRRQRFELIQSYLAGRVFPTPQRMAESRIVANRVKNLVAEAIRGEAGYKSSLERLKAFVPLDSGAYPDIDVPWLSGARGLDDGEWLNKALADNPELRARRLTVEGAGLERSLASRESLPDTALIASYEKGQADIIGKDYGLGLSLAFPSWNLNRSGVKSADQKRLSEVRLLEHAEQRLKAELLRALVEFEGARQVVLKYPPETLPELEGQLKEADEGFRRGQVDLLTFLELDASAAETYGRVLDAQAELAGRAADVLALTADRDALAKLASF